ncbi:hypothetical protein F444_07240, partial [Phytophthora nicotianae P1976]
IVLVAQNRNSDSHGLGRMRAATVVAAVTSAAGAVAACADAAACTLPKPHENNAINSSLVAAASSLTQSDACGLGLPFSIEFSNVKCTQHFQNQDDRRINRPDRLRVRLPKTIETETIVPRSGP